ncbi:MAG: hypothetical protein AABM42_02100 [Actinomycetota bacterium]
MSAVAAAMVLAGCTDETTGSEETLNFTELDKSSHFALIGNAAENRTPPPGSGFALSIPHQDSSKKTVGEINAICISTKPSPPGGDLEGTCSGTADVPDGQLAINVGGEVGYNVSSAIVGGTGKYEGAAGTFTSKSSGEGSKDTFNITLP